MVKPSFKAGVEYWNSTEASVNGVLGGYGATSVPRLDALASRMLILAILPSLSTIIPPHRTNRRTSETKSTKIISTIPRRSFRALDCGAGIGRITSTVLLPIFNRVDVVEPVAKFLQVAKENAISGQVDGWKLLGKGMEGKGIRLWLSGLQFFDPSAPGTPIGPLVEGGEEGTSELYATVGDSNLIWPEPSTSTEIEDGYDLIMIQ